MLLKIIRFKNIFDGTLGRFELIKDNNAVLKGYTLEPAGEDCVTPNQDKRIPEGNYKALSEFSPKFKTFLPVLFNEKVSKSRRILIHSGNYPKHTQGCILIGDRFDDSGVYNSKAALDEFLKNVGRGEFGVEIINAF